MGLRDRATPGDELRHPAVSFRWAAVCERWRAGFIHVKNRNRHRSGVFAVKPIAAATSLCIALFASPAHAAFHLMKVVEVFAGSSAAPAAQYVTLQMYNSGQNQVGGHGITVSDAAGSVIQTFSFSGAVANGAAQSRILIATPEAAALFGMTADLGMTAVLPPAGGKVCFDASPVDCLAWGNYSGSLAGIGTPFAAATGLTPGNAAIRRLDVSGGAGMLEATDDTDNCASDFVAGIPRPRNNGTIYQGHFE